MVYNMDFLIAAMVILLLILWDFLGQKRADDSFSLQSLEFWMWQRSCSAIIIFRWEVEISAWQRC